MEGKKGVALRAAADSALNPTDEHKAKLAKQ